MFASTVRAALLAITLSVCTVVQPSGADAQLPETFSNLQVLPVDMPRSDLIDVMRSFTRATGFRCSGCHMGEEGQPLSEYDFASDDRPAKQKARAMLQMVQAINSEHLATLPDRSQPSVNVTCTTCHGGVSRPVPIEDVLMVSIAVDGVEAATGEYRALREAFHGSRAFDFREGPLLDVAQVLADDGDAASALAIMDLSLSYFPASTRGYTIKGEIHAGADQTAEAIAAFERALELNPENPVAARRLNELRGGG